VKFQYNKTSMQRMERDLRVRLRALPALQAKETALRLEIKKLSGELKTVEYEERKLKTRAFEFAELWLEYPDLLRIQETDISFRNVAGVKIPVLQSLSFAVREYSLYANRAWIPGGSEILKRLTALAMEGDLLRRGLDILRETRKKTTQKVNLYEKVQIPSYREAIRKIKRYLEDEENLSRSAQKIVKKRVASVRGDST